MNVDLVLLVLVGLADAAMFAYMRRRSARLTLEKRMQRTLRLHMRRGERASTSFGDFTLGV
jgi:hypothetical protein